MTTAALFLLLALAAQAQPVQEFCAPCHSGPSEEFDGHPHKAKGLSCDACHGPSVKHRESQGDTPPDRIAGPLQVPALCGTCHAAQLAAYKPSKHYETLLARIEGKRAPNCSTCHSTHSARSLAAIQAQCQRCHESLPATCKPSACASCHNPHSSKTGK